MNLRLAALAALAGWLGATLLLSHLRWFARRPLHVRLGPYLARSAPDRSPIAGTVPSFRAVVGPLAESAAARLTAALGVSDHLAARLERMHSPVTVADVRLRQVAWAGAGLVIGVLAAQLVELPAAAVALVVVGGPILGALLVEHAVIRGAAAWQERTFLELPIVAEQLGMLLSAGYSLGAALNHVATRGQGACQVDLTSVSGRIKQGLSEIDALREWAGRVDVAEVAQLVDILALNREAGDLGRLISEEARSARREVQRQALATIERRSQQVWIPVTVATLVPGVLLLAVPFIEAMRLFSGG
jgi:Flp pilus assembly protein TadB